MLKLKLLTKMNLVRVLLDILLTNNTRSKYPHELFELIVKERFATLKEWKRGAHLTAFRFRVKLLFCDS